MKSRIAVATLALFVVAGGIAYAAIPDAGSGTFHACMLKGLGTIRIIDPAQQHCASIETPISFGAKGDPGLQGSPGHDGVGPTVAQLAVGNANCPAGGAAITDASGSTAYVCSGANGADGQSFSGTFTSPNQQYSLSVTDSGVRISSTGGQRIELAGSDITVRGGTVHVESNTNMDIRGGSNVTLQSSSTLSLRGAFMQLNGGSDCVAAVRLSDSIGEVDSATGQLFLSHLTPGSATVCIGG
jgi:hypothetical protein